MDKTENYTKSNSITDMPIMKIRQHTKKVFNEMTAKPKATTVNLRAILCCICSDFGLTEPPFTFEGRRPFTDNGKRTTREVHGVYRTNGNSHSIQVYALTAKKQQTVASKTAINTLLHEFVHYYDTVVLKINSIHSTGFYSRLKCLQMALKA